MEAVLAVDGGVCGREEIGRGGCFRERSGLGAGSVGRLFDYGAIIGAVHWVVGGCVRGGEGASDASDEGGHCLAGYVLVIF